VAATAPPRTRREASEGPGRIRRAAAHVPRELALLLLVVALFGSTWALVVPPWQAPDEDVHFAYSQTLVERHELPGKGPNAVSTAQRLTMNYLNTDAVVLIPGAKQDWSPLSADVMRDELRNTSASDGGSPNAASEYPPGYYLYESVPYELASGSDLLTRLYVMRLFSVAWLLVTTTAAWLLAGELFGRNRLLQLVTAATIGLWPMLSFMSSAINPDGMLVALWTLSTWLGVSILRRGVSGGRAAGLCLCVGLALVTKATALALLPPALFALALGLWRVRGAVSARHLKWAAVAVLAFAIPVGSWVLVARGSGHSAYGQAAQVTQGASAPAPGGVTNLQAPREVSPAFFASYLWQFYLPKLPSMQDQRFVFPIISHYPAYEVWLASGWASFGWVNIWFPPWVYRIFLAIFLAVATGAAIAFARGARTLRAVSKPARRATLATAAFIALTVGTLLAGLHWTDFHMLVDGKPPFIQGRYMLPVGALLAAVVALAVRTVPTRFRLTAAGAVLGGLVALQIACLGLVTAHFYA
jgi:4-amino-4-deoxy-L-arabinose transferase-like glycosyltransferase